MIISRKRYEEAMIKAYSEGQVIGHKTGMAEGKALGYQHGYWAGRADISKAPTPRERWESMLLLNRPKMVSDDALD